MLGGTKNFHSHDGHDPLGLALWARAGFDGLAPPFSYQQTSERGLWRDDEHLTFLVF